MPRKGPKIALAGSGRLASWIGQDNDGTGIIGVLQDGEKLVASLQVHDGEGNLSAMSADGQMVQLRPPGGVDVPMAGG